ncbi:MAG: DUF2207 domain-containing protein [Rhodobacteraceae bacterium]|nr:DUF2207 domain-containing protein [Paracoccaceae bacterium]
MPYHLVKALLVVAGLWFSLGSAYADERILSYDSQIEVAEDGLLTVTETIKVRAEGREIRRGIYRDFPLLAENKDGRRYRVSFDLLSVRRDGLPEPFSEDDNGNGVRVYIGSSDIFLQSGIYTYEIRYETDRQIRFFDTHDEIYWNVTGNDWAFPIDAVSATVKLPKEARPTEWIAYTGAYGETGQAYRAEVSGSDVEFKTTETLRRSEGLTIVVSLAKGVITSPSAEQQFGFFLRDYIVELIGVCASICALLYYLIVWWMVGKDPKRGVIFPRFEVPEKISPALAHYIFHREFSDAGWLAMSAACLNLAVKGRLVIGQENGDLTLSQQGKEPSHVLSEVTELPTGEAYIDGWIKKRGGDLVLNKANGKSIALLGNGFRTAIERENRSVFFKDNLVYLLPGVLFSIASIVGLFVNATLDLDQTNFVIVLAVFSIFGSFFSISLGVLLRRLSNPWVRVSASYVLFAVILYGALSMARFVTEYTGPLPMAVIFTAFLIVISWIFLNIIDAPTLAGRKVLDELEGLMLYMTTAEKDRMNMSDAPEMSSTHFEALLPYAMALGVEKPWSRAFQSWLAAAVRSGADYKPNWYAGSNFDVANISSSLNSTVGSMAQSFQTSVPAPKSSSSGSSSGSSGGGGGGGGGGGW